METGLKIANVWGIPIRLHASWFVIFGLVSWSLASAYFPQEYPGQTPAQLWGMGVLTSLLFAASVLLHELGHSYMAVRSGIPVKGVTLFIFGGVAQISREPSSPGVEFRVAAAGPLVSLALAGLFGGLWLALRGVPLLAGPGQWLARINLSLAAFNLIPGFPLDGGRVLRAAVWRWTGSFQRATHVATSSGQVVAFGFMAYGLFNMLQGRIFDGIWLVFIGWFLQNAAASVYAHASLEQALRGIVVSQVMTRELPGVPAVMRLEPLVQEQILGGGQRVFVVIDEATGLFRGMLTLQEIKEIPREQWAQTTVGQIMRLPDQLVSVTPQTALMDALRQMDDAGVAQVPVLEGRMLVGLLHREQVLHYLRVRAEIKL